MWKGWILKPSHPELLATPIRVKVGEIVLQKSSLSESEIESFKLYLYFRIDEVIQWTTKDRTLKEFEFMYDLLSKTDVLLESELNSYYDVIREEYGKIYFSPKCGRLFYSTLVSSELTLYNESQIDTISFKSPNIADLREYFEAYILQQGELLLNGKISSENKSKFSAMKAVLGKVPFWRNKEIDDLMSQLKGKYI